MSFKDAVITHLDSNLKLGKILIGLASGKTVLLQKKSVSEPIFNQTSEIALAENLTNLFLANSGKLCIIITKTYIKYVKLSHNLEDPDDLLAYNSSSYLNKKPKIIDERGVDHELACHFNQAKNSLLALRSEAIQVYNGLSGERGPCYCFPEAEKDSISVIYEKFIGVASNSLNFNIYCILKGRKLIAGSYNFVGPIQRILVNPFSSNFIVLFENSYGTY